MKISLEFCILAIERAQALGSYFENFSSLRYTAPDQTAPTGDHRHLAREFARQVADDIAPFLVKIGLHDVHGSGNQDEERDLNVIRFKQYLAGLHFAEFAEGPDAVDLCFSQCWKSLRIRVEDAGSGPCRHVFSPF